jgi:ribosomal protein S18 acetylase RimI-like enzyme
VTVQIRRGLAEAHRPGAAALYWEAFAGKLGPVIGPRARAEAFLEDVMDPVFAVSAVAADGSLAGLFGFKTRRGAFVQGDYGDMRAHFGLLGATWRAPVLAVLDREAVGGQLLLDGICVRDSARGQGIGTALIAEAMALARDLGHREVRLDVIDTNPRAMRLYSRLGFEVADWHDLGVLGGAFGFRRAATMLREVPARAGRLSQRSPLPVRAA